MSRVLITGANGMLGSALLSCVPEGVEALGVDLAEGDLTNAKVAREVVGSRAPRVVIHCAAMTDVDGCTREPERAMLVNCTATANVAEACREVGARLLYISTDYVFAGDLGRSYTEEDDPRPLSPYGESKLCGERAAARVEDHVVVRTQWLYGPNGKNFVATIVKAARTRPELRVVADEWGSPTYTRDLAAGLWVAAASEARGVLHLTNSGVCTWHDLAVAAVRAAGLATPVVPISSAEWPSPTVRPRFSPLENRRWRDMGHEALRPWQEAVEEYVVGWLCEGQ